MFHFSNVSVALHAVSVATMRSAPVFDVTHARITPPWAMAGAATAITMANASTAIIEDQATRHGKALCLERQVRERWLRTVGLKRHLGGMAPSFVACGGWASAWSSLDTHGVLATS